MEVLFPSAFNSTFFQFTEFVNTYFKAASDLNHLSYFFLASSATSTLACSSRCGTRACSGTRPSATTGPLCKCCSAAQWWVEVDTEWERAKEGALSKQFFVASINIVNFNTLRFQIKRLRTAFIVLSHALGRYCKKVNQCRVLLQNLIALKNFLDNSIEFFRHFSTNA